jgi:O-antigen ligase
VNPDPHDELLKFFKARTLQVGYSTAIFALAALYIVSLSGSRYVAILLPLALAISLLVPAFVYRRLDRRAGADE